MAMVAARVAVLALGMLVLVPLTVEPRTFAP
jgi:hypothetical protein